MKLTLATDGDGHYWLQTPDGDVVKHTAVTVQHDPEVGESIVTVAFPWRFLNHEIDFTGPLPDLGGSLPLPPRDPGLRSV